VARSENIKYVLVSAGD